MGGGEPGLDCRYESQKGVRIASEFTHRKDGISFYAENTPCVVEEALISYLADNGFLDRYKVDKSFDFEPISKFENGALHHTDVPHRRRTLVDKLKDKINF